ncbi:MAG: transmembrane 220 family protein [Pseudomonadales bacterium]
MPKTLAFAASVLLLAMATAQFNDTNGIYWILLYTSAAAVPICLILIDVASSRLKAGLFYIALTLTLLGVISSLDSVNLRLDAIEQSISNPMQAATPYIEGNREFAGSLIALLIIFWARLASHTASYG